MSTAFNKAGYPTFTDKDKMVEFYARMVKDCSCPYTTQLVYKSDNKVTAGFGKKVLLKDIPRK